MLKKFIIPVLFGLTTQSFSAEANYLFFQTASQGTLQKMGQSDYLLTLDYPSEYINYFSERPVRKAGVSRLKEFFSLWDSNSKVDFSKNPPNAAITMIPTKGSNTQELIATISKPSFSRNSVSYHLKSINDTHIETGNYKHVVLFFDSIPWNSGGF